ncbi:alpha/beta hydrolase family protein [Spirosoma soli]|uniref:Alpha/beta hydrolase family protein n=1 Tax=Spirosoma soli TaxID=1770529 RepID=A0ABW5M8B3_9BACT
MITIKSLFALFFIGGLLVLTPTGCKTGDNTSVEAPTPARTLVNGSLVNEYSVSQLKSRYSGVSALFQVLIVNPIKVYRLEYMTTNTDGKTVKASGALLVPAPSTPRPMPMLSMQHGTITSDSDAPSNYGSSSEAYTFGSVFASQGYIIAAPDYIGYGASKDLPHTYEQREGLATASLDMLRAAREFMSDQKISWDNRLYLAGYSEGGYATMALQKKIEEETGSEFNLVASSCGAGAYDKPAFMREIINETTSAEPSINRLYVWVLLTYDRIYGLNRPMTYYFKEPYASQIAAQGKDARINASLNTVFTDSFKQAINDGTDKAFLAAVQDNDIHDWKPRTRTQLYHGDADDTVFYLNTQNAYEAMQKRGATNVELKTLKGANHATGILGYITGTYGFFGPAQQ